MTNATLLASIEIEWWALLIATGISLIFVLIWCTRWTMGRFLTSGTSSGRTYKELAIRTGIQVFATLMIGFVTQQLLLSYNIYNAWQVAAILIIVWIGYCVCGQLLYSTIDTDSWKAVIAKQFPVLVTILINLVVLQFAS